jgi:hypothetical protein
MKNAIANIGEIAKDRRHCRAVASGGFSILNFWQFPAILAIAFLLVAQGDHLRASHRI